MFQGQPPNEIPLNNDPPLDIVKRSQMLVQDFVHQLWAS